MCHEKIVHGSNWQIDLSEPEGANNEPLPLWEPLSNDNMEHAGVPQLITALLDTELPFRVMIFAEIEAYHAATDHDVQIPFRPPPWTMQKRSANALDSWSVLWQRMREAINMKLENQGGRSGLEFVGISQIHVTVMGYRNLRQLQRLSRTHIRAGCFQERLPIELANKGVFSMQNRDFSCFRCCIIAYHLGLSSSHRWTEYLLNGHHDGRYPKDFEPMYVEVPLGVRADFSMIPQDRLTTAADLDEFEKQNPKYYIYVYEWRQCDFEDQGRKHAKSFIAQIRAPSNIDPNLKDQYEIALLQHQRHFSLITDFNKFRCETTFSQGVNGKKGAASCIRCMEIFWNWSNVPGWDKLQNHLKTCKGLWEPPPQAARLPSRKIEGDRVSVKFLNHKNKYRHPVVVYADCETFRTPVVGSETRHATYENRHLASIGMHTVADFDIDDEFRCAMWTADQTEDVFVSFLFKLIKLCVVWLQQRRRVEKIKMSSSDQARYFQQEQCEHCGHVFASSKEKNRDHCHVTGAFRACLCRSCNLKAQQVVTIPVLVHNCSNYDTHFFLRGITKVQNSEKYMYMSASKIAGVEDKEGNSTMLKDWKLTIIASTDEKYKSVAFTCGRSRFGIKFVDTCTFIKDSLASIITMQKQARENLQECFPIMCSYHPFLKGHPDRMELLLQKVPFPYAGLTDPSVFSDVVAPLLSRGLYDNDLNLEKVTDKGIEMVSSVIRECGLVSFKQYHDLYLATDVLALADCFEEFRKCCISEFELDPVHYIGLPGFAQDSMYLKSKAVIHNLCAEDCGGEAWSLSEDIRANIRGGLCVAFASHFQAGKDDELEKKRLKTEPENLQRHLCCFDATSLYPTMMTHPIPVGEYEKEALPSTAEKRLEWLERTLDDYDRSQAKERGMMLVVTFHIPASLHDYFDLAPPVDYAADISELSKRQQQIAIRKYIEEGDHAEKFAEMGQQEKVEFLVKYLKLLRKKNEGIAQRHGKERTAGKIGFKLTPHLGERTQGLHIALALELRRFGAVFTAVHRAWSWKQVAAFSSFMNDVALARGQAAKGPRKNMLKSILVSCFGKTIENKEAYRNIRIHTRASAYERFGSSKYCDSYRLQELEHNERGDITSFLGLTSHKTGKQIVLDKPRAIGWAVLEMSKAAMLKFHYGLMKQIAVRNQWRLHLLYSDTDSLYYGIEGEGHPVQALRAINHYFEHKGKRPPFDLSSREECLNAGKLHTYKLEYDYDPVEGIFLAPKLYALRFQDGQGPVKKEDGEEQNFLMKAKGVSSAGMKRAFNFDSFRNMLYNVSGGSVDLVEMRSRNHKVLHHTFTKQALTAFTDKVFTVSAARSVPFGYEGALGKEEDCNFALFDITGGALDIALARIGKQKGVMLQTSLYETRRSEDCKDLAGEDLLDADLPDEDSPYEDMSEEDIDTYFEPEIESADEDESMCD